MREYTLVHLMILFQRTHKNELQKKKKKANKRHTRTTKRILKNPGRTRNWVFLHFCLFGSCNFFSIVVALSERKFIQWLRFETEITFIQIINIDYKHTTIITRPAPLCSICFQVLLLDLFILFRFVSFFFGAIAAGIRSLSID